MAARRTEMDRLQELVRLHRLNSGGREVARLLKMSPNTERKYRLALETAGLLHGCPTKLPELDELKEAVLAACPVSAPPAQERSGQRAQPMAQRRPKPTPLSVLLGPAAALPLRLCAPWRR